MKHPGILHTKLGVAKGRKVPTRKLESAAKKGGKLGHRAQLAIVTRDMHRGLKHT